MLKKERNNLRGIYLYCCGKCRMALERSAYLIHEIFHYNGNISVFCLMDGKRFVMIEESDFIVSRIRNSHSCEERTDEYVRYDVGRTVAEADIERWKGRIENRETKVELMGKLTKEQISALKDCLKESKMTKRRFKKML